MDGGDKRGVTFLEEEEEEGSSIRPVKRNQPTVTKCKWEGGREGERGRGRGERGEGRGEREGREVIYTLASSNPQQRTHTD